MPIEFQTSSGSREIDCRVKEGSGLQVPNKYPNLINTDYKILGHAFLVLHVFSSRLLFPFITNIKLMVASSTHIAQSFIASFQACVLNIIHSGERIKFQRTISNLWVPLYLMNIAFMIWSIWRQLRKVRNLTSSIWKPGGSLKYRSKWGNSCSC